MIYLTYTNEPYEECSSVKNVWESDISGLEHMYGAFLLNEAKEMNFIINPHWYNGMDHENNNTHLTLPEYKKKLKQWNKFLKKYSFEYYISSKKLAIKVEHKHIFK